MLILYGCCDHASRWSIQTWKISDENFVYAWVKHTHVSNFFRNSDLAFIENVEKLNFLKSLISEDHWTCGNDGDNANEGIFKWQANGFSVPFPEFNLFDFASWAPGQPSNTLFENDRGQGQDGLVLQPDGLFNDKRKADKLPFICQGNRGNQRKL